MGNDGPRACSFCGAAVTRHDSVRATVQFDWPDEEFTGASCSSDVRTLCRSCGQEMYRAIDAVEQAAPHRASPPHADPRRQHTVPDPRPTRPQ